MLTTQQVHHLPSLPSGNGAWTGKFCWVSQRSEHAVLPITWVVRTNEEPGGEADGREKILGVQREAWVTQESTPSGQHLSASQLAFCQVLLKALPGFC